MWVHPDLAKDKQWDSNKLKQKEKSCNIVSVLPDDDNVTVASLSDSEDEKYAFAAQDATPQPTGTRSGKSYLRQYEKTADETQQLTTSPKLPVLALVPTPAKEKQKEVWFDRVLKRTLGLGLDAPFCFDIFTQYANIPARITMHELLCLSKETREALMDALANSESFLIHMPDASEDDSKPLCPECHYVQLKLSLIHI